MRSKCYLVKLQEFRRISDKCFVAKDFCGNEELIPASQCYGMSIQYDKGIGVYLTDWILSHKSLTYSMKDVVWIDERDADCDGFVQVEKIIKHSPERLSPVKGAKADASLVR